ncbi:hypothetical protein TEA_010971 [Camellia sinensis var. sinensis]|uniref:Uncharacterized protein n=1 Tax=Camellia sinensis var. sinensis TaxID=542762 RepID=A0A4S4DCT6_CAMSN|nr:hypothetical protein TEA_010971 [Camellia sinensis var. sinensis]
MRRGTPTCRFDDHLVPVPIVHVDLGFLDRTRTGHDRFRRGPVKNGFSTSMGLTSPIRRFSTSNNQNLPLSNRGLKGSSGGNRRSSGERKFLSMSKENTEEYVAYTDTIYTGGFNSVTRAHVIENSVDEPKAVKSELVCGMKGCYEKAQDEEWWWIGWDMAEPPSSPLSEKNKFWKGVFAVGGIMSTLIIYGVLQEKIMRVPYGEKKEYFKYSLFLVFCNRLTTSAVSAGALLASKKALNPVAPLYKYCLVSVTNILTTTCQYEALKYVSFPVQTLAKCAKMIPVMAAGDISPYNRGRESTVWGVSLMVGYLGVGFGVSELPNSIGLDMVLLSHSFILIAFVNDEIKVSKFRFRFRFKSNFSHQGCGVDLWKFDGVITLMQGFNLCLILQGHLLMAIDFVASHHDCFLDIALLSTLASILLSCIWFAHPLSWEQCIGAVIVFGALYAKSFLRNKSQKPLHPERLENLENRESIPLKGNP